MEYNNDFSHDLRVGQIGETYLATLLEDKKIEVKTDYKASITRNVFIEYESRKKPSGIATTLADFYAFIISNENIILIATERLKVICRKYMKTNRNVVGGDMNTSRGILLPLEELINPVV